VADYLRAHYWRFNRARPLDDRWLLESLAFHWRQDTLAVVYASGPPGGGATIAAVMIAWQEDLSSLKQRAEGQLFQWQATNPLAHAVYWSTVLATAPGAFAQGVQELIDKHPEWLKLELYAHRRGRLVRRTGAIHKLLKLK
jgi:hypothetical protein